LSPASDIEIRTIEPLPIIRTTRVPLQQVLMNLLANAIKHNDADVPVIEVGAEPNSEHWELYVRDNGPGIAPRYHARVWGLFQTLQSRDRTSNSGIGLAIVRKIVEAHGGRVWIDSEERAGATFRFTWPKAIPSTSWKRLR
jgi:signal transduction histidine kinase